MLDKNECEKAIRKIAILTRDINNFVQFQAKKEENWSQKVIISSWQTEKWAWVTELPAILEGDEITVAVNWKYITDFIRTMASDTLVFNIVSSQKPLVLMDKDDTTNRYVVRPLTA